jgi:inhibitor of KinA sporulation pathway (predicted exonuclease)
MSRKKLFDHLVIIDLEATCDEPKPLWQSEIIEVGVCLLDLRTLEITKPRGLLVKPERTPITAFCTNLTTITPELVAREGITLAEAMRILEKEYKLDERTWASWGDYDRKMLEKDCEAKGISFPGRTRSHINLKNLLTVELGLPWENGLDNALERFGLKLEGTHHRGVDDAKNIARIYQRHLQKVRAPEKSSFDLNQPGAGYPYGDGWDR